MDKTCKLIVELFSVVYSLNVQIKINKRLYLEFRTAEELLNQVGTNTSNLNELQHQLEKRAGKHVDAREAILKKRDEQLKGNMYNVYVVNVNFTLTWKFQHYFLTHF